MGIPPVEWPPEPGEGDDGGGEVELLLLAQLARVLPARAGLGAPPAGAVRRQRFLEASLKLVPFVESSIWTEEANLIYSHFCSYKCRWQGSTKLKISPALSGTPSHTGGPSKPAIVHCFIKNNCVCADLRISQNSNERQESVGPPAEAEHQHHGDHLHGEGESVGLNITYSKLRNSSPR